jgi:voltage-gated potassium channel Kch
VLIQAGIREANTLVLASDDDALNLAVLTQARLLNPHIRIINRLYNQVLGDRLDRTLPDHFSMSVSSLAAPIFAFTALGNKAIGQLRLFNKTWPIHEEVIDENHPWLGLNLSQLWDNPARMLIHYLPVQGEMDLVSAVVKKKTLQRGDHLIIGTKPIFRGKRSRLSHKLLKPFVNLRQYQRHARPVALVTLALIAIICLATLTYVLVNFHTSLVDALYFSVGMITGAGGKEEVAEKGPSSLKIFTAIMMIVGAGVIGICYALINDFVLGSRFKEFLDAARVPTRNHYIVCGLGGIGMEIVRQLHSQGYEVVVIEPDHNNRFLHSARSLGVPIILADASLDNSLKAANIQNAEALLAVTSKDMVNVEISLTAKAIAPKLSLIVRCQDSEFARSVGEVFGFEIVLSPTELATHSFAAAALGGKILGNGMTDDLLWVALATMITPAHPFCGQSVKNVAMSAHFVPLYLERKTCTIHGWKLLDVVLQSEDILYLTIPANELEQLWRTRQVRTHV